MAPDDRDMLELLEQELDFMEKGGYGRSVRTPWLPKSIFQDSLSCLNYAHPKRIRPCSECALLDFVPPEHQSDAVPCHHIPLDAAGDTIEELAGDNESKSELLVKEWLRARIHELQMAQELGPRQGTHQNEPCSH